MPISFVCVYCVSMFSFLMAVYRQMSLASGDQVRAASVLTSAPGVLALSGPDHGSGLLMNSNGRVIEVF